MNPVAFYPFTTDFLFSKEYMNVYQSAQKISDVVVFCGSVEQLVALVPLHYVIPLIPSILKVLLIVFTDIFSAYCICFKRYMKPLMSAFTMPIFLTASSGDKPIPLWSSILTPIRGSQFQGHQSISPIRLS